MKLTLIAALVSAAAMVQAASVKKCQKKYEVVDGDTCESIALKLGFTKDNFEKWNQELDTSFNCDNLKKKQKICIKFPSSIQKRSEKKKNADKKKKTTTKKHVPAKKTTTKKPSPAKKTTKKPAVHTTKKAKKNSD